MASPIDRTAKGALDTNLVNGTLSDAPKIKANNDTLYNYVDQLASEAQTHLGASVLPHADGSVTTAKLADYCVTTQKILDRAITGPKIALGAITSEHIGTGATSETVNGARIDGVVAQLVDIAINLKRPPAPLVGAKGDWNGVTGTDDTAAIQTIIDYATTAGVDVLCSGNFLIKNPLNITCGIQGDGKFILDSQVTTPIFNFPKTYPAVNTSFTGLSGLTQGSKKITGLTGKRGYVGVLASTDVMIERTGGQDSYYKRDVFLIVSDDGDLSVALDNTYNTATSSLTLYQLDRPITIDGLTIEIANLNAAGNTIMEVKRSNVSFRSLTLRNYTSNQIQYGVAVSEAVFVDFYNLNINGAMFYTNPGIGYGVNIYNSAHITLNECHIYDCRHSTSGRHAKDVKIVGGVHGNSIDCHWGMDWKIRDCTVYVQKTYNGNTNYMAILYAGSNLSVENCTVYGAKYFIGVRDDTPELRGDVSLIWNKWYPELENDYAWYAFSTGDNTNSYSHTIVNPERVAIENNKLFAPLMNSSTTSYVRYYSNGYNRTYACTKVREIVIRNNYHGDLPAKFLEIRKNTARIATSEVTKVIIENMDGNSQNVALAFANQETYANIMVNDYTSGYANVDRDLYDLFMTDCRNIHVYVDATTIRKGIFSNVTFCYRFHRRSTTQDGSSNWLQPTDCQYKFDRCEFLYYSNHNSGTELFWFRMELTNVFITNSQFKCNMSFDNSRFGVGSFNSVVYYTNGNLRVAGKTFTGTATINGLVNATYSAT